MMMDAVLSELLQYVGEFLAALMHYLIVKMWESESIPTQWYESTLVPLFKKDKVYP